LWPVSPEPTTWGELAQVQAKLQIGEGSSRSVDETKFLDSVGIMITLPFVVATQPRAHR